MKTQPPVTVAIVDDNIFMRESVKFRLTSQGYKIVMEAENGQEFLDKLKDNTAPDICLLDVNMPVMDGFETAMHLKKNWPAIKILFFSMEDINTCANKVNQLGVEGFIAKDAPFEQLNTTLSMIASKQQMANNIINDP